MKKQRRKEETMKEESLKVPFKPLIGTCAKAHRWELTMKKNFKKQYKRIAAVWMAVCVLLLPGGTISAQESDIPADTAGYAGEAPEMMDLGLLLEPEVNDSFRAAAVTLEGLGTAVSPYLIRTAEDLYSLNGMSKTSGLYFKMVNDIDLLNIQREPLTNFYGYFDGGGYTIKNLRLVPRSDGKLGTGLFSQTSGCSIKNLTIQNAEINSDYVATGIFIGFGMNLNIENCRIINSTINGAGDTGGFAGVLQDSKVSDSSISGLTIHASNIEGLPYRNFGGICGINWTSDISNCHVRGLNIEQLEDIYLEFTGGLCGYASDAEIINCSAEGSIGGPNLWYVGGLIGRADNMIVSKCSANTSLYGGGAIGGLVGVIGTPSTDSVQATVLSDSYAAGSAKAFDETYYVGGVSCNAADAADFKVINCYSAVYLDALHKVPLCRETGVVTNSYFDQQAAGVSEPAANARTAEQMAQQANYVGWDFAATWYMDAAGGYPKLRDMPEFEQSMKKFTLTPESAVMAAGDTLRIEPVFIPAVSASTVITWQSSNPSVLTVDASGTVTAAASGFAAVAALTEDGRLAFCNILVEVPVQVIPVEGVHITPEALALEEGSTAVLTAEVYPGNADNKAVTWESSDPSIASVDAFGTVTAHDPGTAVVTVTTVDGSYTASALVTVNPAVPVNIALTALASSNNESSSANNAAKAIDGNPETRWLARNNSTDVYLELDFGGVHEINRIQLIEFGGRIDSFAIQVWDGTGWTDIYSGNGMDGELDIAFEEVAADKVRLMVYNTYGTYGPSIYEFEVYE